MIHGRRVERIVENWVHVCSISREGNGSAPAACKPFDPWHGNFVDCV